VGTPAPVNAKDMSFMMKPTPPIAIVPSRHIFIESQSSVLPGFVASFNNLEADLKNDLSPKVPHTFQKSILVCKVRFRNNHYYEEKGTVPFQ
jgi:hypothetical protein